MAPPLNKRVSKKSTYIKDLDKLGSKYVNDIVSKADKLRQLTNLVKREILGVL